MIEFDLDLSEARSHLLKVRMRFRTSVKEEIVMPVWAPGSYMVRDFSRHISWIKPIKGILKQIDKTRYSVEGGEVEIEYGVYADELSVQTSYADSDFVLINGSSVFFYVEGRKNEYYNLKLLNNTHSYISTSMNLVDGNFQMENYDDFIDSPILLHDGIIEKFEIDHKEHEICIVGNFKRELTSFVEDIRKIVTQSKEIFGELPYDKKYTFIFILAPDDLMGGLEHKASTVILGNENRIVDDYDYLVFKTIISHEFFHTWNVKRIRPVELGPFDYTKENYTNLLWLSEGFTSYYEWILLLRAGIAKFEDYYRHLEEALNYYFIQPGYAHRDANSSSFNSWIKLYKPDGDLINNYISYYLKGELMAIVLNAIISRDSSGTKNLDEFMRSLWLKFKMDGKGIRYNDLVDLLLAMGIKNAKEIMEELAEKPGDMNLLKILEEIGLGVNVEIKKNGFLGLVLQSTNGKITVRYSIKGYPAYEAGILPGDEIVAINNERMTDANMEDYVKEWRGFKVDNIKWITPNSQVKVTFFRRNILRNVNVISAEYPRKYKITERDREKLSRILIS